MPTLKIEVTIPAIKEDTSYRNEGVHPTDLKITLTESGHVKLSNYEFVLDDLIEAVNILRQHNALRT